MKTKKPILVAGNLPGEVLDYLREDFEVVYHAQDRPLPRERLLRSLPDKTGLLSMITDRIDEEVFDRAPHLVMVANMAVGYNNIDVAAATRRGILVSNTPGVLTETTADLAFALLLAAARRVIEGDRMVRSGRFKFWAPFHFLGREVAGKTLGIIGMGRIGRAVARRARGFGMTVVYYSRSPLKKSLEKRLHATFLPLEALLREADYVSLHVPLSAETTHLIGSAELALMKPTAFLINTSRGPVVDEEALLAALRQGVIAGAGIDVYEHEPAVTAGLEKIASAVLLPHVGSATLETRTRMAWMAAENLRTGLRGERPPHLVNPQVWRKKKRNS
ncbi:MAG TPA: D-glycerate dehydrogenase [Syntrophales bacterium]|jgi:glyoxylate reductase|nr:D-glycerate dehydrogenase [Syntrophales bacterium]HON22339.1 D-glycerate dehydrogenase [Syntrophales bacterium]HOU76587.1 D-glycerate dehydrogenase [Syntrophales bacterium]HPC31344.1 D-glycerate dehydrogenase [Syntrophales bacterium]HQG33250.1 D-glycerate dehydrogenase [Syntrophales bacterium]